MPLCSTSGSFGDGDGGDTAAAAGLAPGSPGPSSRRALKEHGPLIVGERRPFGELLRTAKSSLSHHRDLPYR